MTKWLPRNNAGGAWSRHRHLQVRWSGAGTSRWSSGIKITRGSGKKRFFCPSSSARVAQFYHLMICPAVKSVYKPFATVDDNLSPSIIVEGCLHGTRIAWIFLLFVFAAAPRLLLGQNLVLNGDFEKGADEWRLFSPAESKNAGCEFSVVAGQGRDGRHAAVLQSVNIGRYGIYPAEYMHITVKARERYKFVAWVKAGDNFHQEAGTPGVVMRATLFERPGVDYAPGHIFIGMNGVSQPSAAPLESGIVPKVWTKIEGVIEIPQGVTQMIFFVFCWKASGKFWVDDVSVTKLP